MDIKEGKVLLLMKFGNESNLHRLVKEGMVFINPLSTFKTKDENKQRFDELEGTATNIILTDAVIEIRESSEEPWKKLEITSGRITEATDVSNLNSYSLFAFTDEHVADGNIFKLDPRFKEFGSHFAIIRNPVDFLTRIGNAIRDKGFEYALGPVEYLDYRHTHHNMTIFNKSDEYEHQQEFRILVKTNEQVPLTIFIGSIESYTEIYPTDWIELFQIRAPL